MGYIALIDNNQKWILTPSHLFDFFDKNYRAFSFSKIEDLDRPYSYEWDIKEPRIEGFLHKKGDSVHFDGTLDDCFDFIIKLRQIIPLSENILFFDSSYNFNTIIEENTTIENLKQIFK